MALLERPDQIASAADLAQAFGWAAADLSSRNIVVDEKTLTLEAAKIEGEGAVVFWRFHGRASPDELNAISLYGYHSSCPWGVVADQDGVHLLSSRWLRDSDWYRLQPIPWAASLASEELLNAFAPQAVRDSEPYRRLLSVEEPTTLLKSVDDALVERLDAWRERAVRYSRGAVNKVDEQLQTLYAQFFVLRTIEDRGLEDTIPPLISTYQSHDKFDRQQWSIIFNRAKNQIGSDLFSEDVAEGIDPYILSGVVYDLYHPKKIPGRDVRYDFSWISADVLGLAYEKYLSTVLQPAPLPAQAELFLQPQRGVERLSVRKSAGAYYTPRFLTTYLASTCVNRFFETAQPGQLPNIIDFSCGSGSFLVAAVDQVLAHLKRQDPNHPWARELIEGGHLVGIDIDPKAVTAARLHLWQRLIEEPSALPLPNLADVVQTGDGLDISSWGELNKPYDIVLGNPPFLVTSMVSNRDKLEAEFETAKGRYDFSSLFVEQALRVLTDNGVLGLVIPNRLFLNKSAEPLRTVLSQKAVVEVVVDFGSTKIFDADAYVGCVVARKMVSSPRTKPQLRVIQVRSLEPDFMTAELLDAEEGDIGTPTAPMNSYSARQPGSAPWSLLSLGEQRNRILMDDISVRLDSIANVAQGIRTGANDLFVLEVEEDDGSALARIKNGLGDQWFIERDLLEPLVFGSELQRFSEVSPSRKILYAYKNNVAIGELELKDRYPRTWEYLSAYRDLLASRSSLKGTGSNYYELIRPRDERWLRRPKLLIRDLAPATAFALDERGVSFLIGGTAVVPADPELCLPLAAYLNSKVVNSLIKQQTPSFRGDFQKFEPGVLSATPVLAALVEEGPMCSQMRSLASERIQFASDPAKSSEIESQIESLIMSVAAAAGADLVV